MKLYRRLFKRIFDLLLALIGLLILSPLFLVIFLVLLITNQGKPFYTQERPGLNEEIFSIIKFKTMHDRTDSNGELLPDMERITQFGGFIRNYSLDEIPQLLNVIKGDMSLIGPRPLLIRYLPHYNEEQQRRHHVRPGITGWAQVNGRNAIDWDTKFKYDVWYVDNLSLPLDIKIMFMTLVKVFSRKNVYNEDNQIGPEFKGSNI